MYTSHFIKYNPKNGLSKYSIVHYGPIAYIWCKPKTIKQIIKAMNNV